MRPAFPSTGSVLGVDVGYSPKRSSSAACRLDWAGDKVEWEIKRFRAVEPERTEALESLADRPLLAAAFDGPLLPDFAPVSGHRAAERMLTRRLGKAIGKPGSSAGPVGMKLNTATNICATIVLATGRVATATHRQKIDDTVIVEAFPGAALGLMIETPKALTVTRGNRSDIFYQHLAKKGELDRLIAHLLPGKQTASSFATIGNHDERAALVCALTALGLAAGVHTAVGSDGDGWIILPPRALMAEWAWPLLEANAADGAGCLIDAAAPWSSA